MCVGWVDGWMGGNLKLGNRRNIFGGEPGCIFYDIETCVFFDRSLRRLEV